jgi:hypothetical protein
VSAEGSSAGDGHLGKGDGMRVLARLGQDLGLAEVMGELYRRSPFHVEL